jgi:outer membrane lipoprotein-sorting protein
MQWMDERSEPLLGIAGTWHTFRASGTEWRHHARLAEAFERGGTPPPGAGIATVSARLSSDVPGPSESEEPWSLWIEKPDLKRAEFMVGGERCTVVFRGDYWWSWSASRGAQSNDGRTNYSHGEGPSAGLVQSALLPRALQVAEISRGSLLGRDVIHLRGSPRTPTTAEDFRLMTRSLHPLGLGADEYLLAVDAEQGVLLRSEARTAGAGFLVLEMTEIAFDEHFDSQTFVLEQGGV